MASETTWAITDANGTTVLSGGPYTNNNSTPISASTTLDEGCYTLTVNDSYGDGICCSIWKWKLLFDSMWSGHPDGRNLHQHRHMYPTFALQPS